MHSKVASGLCILVLSASSAFAADIPDYPFVYVVGKADTDTRPNIATCSLTLRARDPDANKAAATVAERLKTVLATLRAHHIVPDDIESFEIQKRVLTDDTSGDELATINGYEIWRNLKFTAHQLEAIAPIEGSLVNSANVVDIKCQFDSTDRAAIEAELQTKALRAARDQADKLAEPLGRHVTAVMALSKVPFETIPSSFGFGERPGDFAAKLGGMFKRSVSTDAIEGDDLLVPAHIHMSISVNALFKVE